MSPKTTTKNTILKTSFALFHHHGYHATSMSDIANGVGMTKAGIYHHFNSKEQLLIDILEADRNALQTKLFNIAYGTEGSPEKRLQRFFKKQEQLFLGPERTCFLGKMTLETCQGQEVISDILDAIFVEWQEALAHLFENFKNKKESMILAEQAIIEFEGAIMLALLKKKNNKIIKNALTRIVSRALN